MAHTVDQACLVKGFLVEQGPQIIADCRFIVPVTQILLHVVEHFDHLDVGTAVFGTFQ